MHNAGSLLGAARRRHRSRRLGAQRALFFAQRTNQALNKIEQFTDQPRRGDVIYKIAVRAAQALNRFATLQTRQPAAAVGSQTPWRIATPHLRLCRILIKMADGFLSCSWRIREPHGCTEPRQEVIEVTDGAGYFVQPTIFADAHGSR